MKITHKQRFYTSYIEFNEAIYPPETVVIEIKDFLGDNAFIALDAKEVKKVIKYLQNLLKTKTP